MDRIQIITDAIEKHHLNLDATDPNLQDLVGYALHIGYSEGFKDGVEHQKALSGH